MRRNVTMQPEDEGCVDELRPVGELAAALGSADWLVVTVPHTPETDQSVNAELIGAMPRGGGLINVGRGAVVDEVAVDAALRSGQLRNAYLDVFSVEPLPRSSPLWDTPNLMMSPHDGWYSSGNNGRCRQLFLTTLREHLLGLPVSASFGPPDIPAANKTNPYAGAARL